MKKRLLPLISLVLVIGLLLPASVVLAAYGYSMPVTITNNSTTTYSGIPILASINNSQLHSMGYIDADGLDTRLLEGASDREFMLSNSRLGLFIRDLEDGQARRHTYRLGEDPGQSSFPIITGVGGNITVGDNETLELGDNFTLGKGVWFDASVGGAIVEKEAAFEISGNGVGNVTAEIIGEGGATNSNNSSPDGVGDVTELSRVGGAASNWESVSSDNDATYVLVGGVIATKTDTYALDNFDDVPDGAPVNSVTVYWRARGKSAGATVAFGRPVVRLSGANTLGAEIDVGGDTGTTWKWYSEALARPGGDSWATSDLANLQGGVQLRTPNASYDTWVSEVYLVVNYDASLSVTATGISSGVHTINVTADGTDFKIWVDGVEKDSEALGGVSVPDNGNGWIIGGGGVFGYLDYFSWVINGTEVARYEPALMVAGSVLPDVVGTYDGTINWGTNPDGIEVDIGGITSFADTTATTVTEEEVPEFLEEPEGIHYTGGALEDDDAVLVAMPMYDAVSGAAESLDMKVRTMYIMLMFMTMFAMGVAGYVALGSVWGFVGGAGFGNILALGTPLWPVMLPVLIGVIVILGVFAWRQH